MKHIFAVDIGRTKYADAWELQRKVFSARQQHRIGDVILLTEHDHVYTLGKAADENHLLAKNEELSKMRVEVFWIDRGGDITYHGPGQIVGYPILNLNDYYNDIHRYLRELEEVLIRTLAEYAIAGTRESEFTGVWVHDEKIAALGVKVSKWVTMHGFALNVKTDLSYFDRIIPCGIFHKGVTSLQELLKAEIDLNEVQHKILHHFSHIFNAEIKQISKEELETMLHHNEAVEEKAE